mmetsp:Transcript_10972/g.28513  ORF Transcript_10972/g.28513 Transcript_10972/m.28513 type:complete len:210 (-) Transcript_10972:60-689(-)
MVHAVRRGGGRGADGGRRGGAAHAARPWPATLAAVRKVLWRHAPPHADGGVRHRLLRQAQQARRPQLREPPRDRARVTGRARLGATVHLGWVGRRHRQQRVAKFQREPVRRAGAPLTDHRSRCLRPRGERARGSSDNVRRPMPGWRRLPPRSLTTALPLVVVVDRAVQVRRSADDRRSYAIVLTSLFDDDIIFLRRDPPHSLMSNYTAD